MRKLLFTAEAVEKAHTDHKAQIAQKAERKYKAGSIKTPLGSQVVRNHEVTQTAQLDMIVIAGLAFSENYKVTVTQLAELAKSVGFDLKPKRIAKHIKANKIASLDGTLVSLDKEQAQAFLVIVQGGWFKALCLHFAKELAELLEIRADDFTLLSEEGRKEQIEADHHAAIIMNSNKPVIRKTRKGSKKTAA